jgi:hypothetical protein
LIGNSNVIAREAGDPVSGKDVFHDVMSQSDSV